MRPNKGVSPLDNAAFRRWFGDSKVVDSRGEPLVVYHASRPGTPDFDVFSRARVFDLGMHFGNYDSAKHFDRLGKPRAFYLRITRPLKLEDPTDWLTTTGSYHQSHYTPSTIDQLRQLGVLDKDAYMQLKDAIIENNRRVGGDDEGRFYEASHWVRGTNRPEHNAWIRMRAVISQRITSAIARAGYDGVVYDNTWEGGISWIAFDPRQIKSATDNVGTFDPRDPSILKNGRRTSRRRTR
jgi:hypothetical protein